MKTMLKARFLPPTYVQDCYSQFHNLTQGSMNVEEYTHEFEKLMSKCDIQEPEEQIIVRYLESLILGTLMWLNYKPMLHLIMFVCWLTK